MEPQRLQQVEQKTNAVLAPPQAEPQGAQETVGDLLTWLQQESGRRKKRRRLGIGFICALGAIRALESILLSTLDLSVANLVVANVASSLVMAAGILGIVLVLFSVTRSHKDVARLLARFDDKRAVGPLAEALDMDNQSLRQEAERALIRLLPQLQASDAGLLNDDQRACLYRALAGRKTELTLAILKALEQIGDGKALPVVERLRDSARSTISLRKALQPPVWNERPGGWRAPPLFGRLRAKAENAARILETAEACLPSLRERAAQEQAAQTLLRPATAPGSPAEILLRPAQGVSATDPNLLLRPSDSP